MLLCFGDLQLGSKTGVALMRPPETKCFNVSSLRSQEGSLGSPTVRLDPRRLHALSLSSVFFISSLLVTTQAIVHHPSPPDRLPLICATPFIAHCPSQPCLLSPTSPCHSLNLRNSSRGEPATTLSTSLYPFTYRFAIPRSPVDIWGLHRMT